MISQLRGNVTHLTERFAVLDVGGVGYKVFATGSLLSSLRAGKEAILWTHLAVREDSLDLYGFATEKELAVFELLIGISGIGPKSALGILAIASVETLEKAVASGDTVYLTKVSGIGKKNAQKIVLELRDKLELIDGGVPLQGDVDAVEALKSLGYSHAEARDALKEVPEEITGTGNKVKEALKILSSSKS